VDHLEEPVFMLPRWLDTDGWFLRRGAGVFGGIWMIVDRWADRTPVALMALPFDVAPLRVRACFLGAIVDMKKLF